MIYLSFKIFLIFQWYVEIFCIFMASSNNLFEINSWNISAISLKIPQFLSMLLYWFVLCFSSYTSCTIIYILRNENFRILQHSKIWFINIKLVRMLVNAHSFDPTCYASILVIYDTFDIVFTPNNALSCASTISEASFQNFIFWLSFLLYLWKTPSLIFRASYIFRQSIFWSLVISNRIVWYKMCDTIHFTLKMLICTTSWLFFFYQTHLDYVVQYKH